MNTKLYFAYGSNLDLKQFARRCRTSVPLTPATWDGMELEFRGVATIVKRPGSKLYGALYEIGPKDEDALDLYEGVRSGLYAKRYTNFRLPNGSVEPALWYEMRDADITAPSEGYLDTIVTGYRDWRLPLAHLMQAVDEAKRADKSRRKAGAKQGRLIWAK